MRTRAETIGPLGRAPARANRPPTATPVAPPPTPSTPTPTPPEGAIRGWIRGALFDNLGLKFLSLVLAITVSLLVNTDRDREITAHIGVSYTLPTDKVLVSERLQEVQVTIRGPWRRLRRFDEKRQLDRINLDLSHVTTGELDITPDMVHLPAGLTIGTISPRSIHVAFERRVDKVVEIAAVTAGRPKHGYLVADVKAVPATVHVRGAETTLAALSVIKTREVPLDDRSDSFTADADLVLPDGVELESAPRAAVQVHFDEELVTRRYGELAITVRGDVPATDVTRWTVTPGRVEVTLTGALLAVEQAKDNLTAVVKVTAADGKAREGEVVVQGLPPGVGVKVSPERVKLTPAPRPSPTSPTPPPTP